MPLQSIFSVFLRPKTYSIIPWCFVLFFSLITTLSFTLPAQAAPCHQLDSLKPVPENFGAAYNLFSPNKETLMQVDCDDSDNTVSLTLGTGQDTHYIYAKAYIHRLGQWEPLSLTPTGLGRMGSWIIGSAQASVSLNAQDSSAGNISVFFCDNINNVWKCGCRDEACAEPYWQLQKYYFDLSIQDDIPPLVNAFSIKPQVTTVGGFLTADYQVSDNWGLSYVELWRAPDNAGTPGVWQAVAQAPAGGVSQSGQLFDSPDLTGVFWYGLHATDLKGLVGYEPVPVRVAIMPSSTTPICGNSTCESGENCDNCPTDCGECPAECGDGTCNGEETCSTCPGDCGDCETTDPAGENPQVLEFSVSPRAVSPYGTVTADYRASDNISLSRAELRRADYNPTNCNDNISSGCAWQVVSQAAISGTLFSGRLSDNPPAGMQVYGLRVVDSDSRVGYEYSAIVVNVSDTQTTPACNNGLCESSETCLTCPTDCGVCPAECGDGACNGEETCSTCPADCGECAVSDTQAPQVDSFSVSPTSLNEGQAITSAWSVSDNIALQRIELWRTTELNGQPDSNNWAMVRSANLSGTNVSGTSLDIPPAGTFYYGLHVVDAAGNLGTEAEPVRVVVESTGTSNANVFFYDDCEDAPNLSTDYIAAASGGSSYAHSTEYARAGSGSYKFVVNAGSGLRSEFVPKINYPGVSNYNLRFEHDYWYGYSLYLPADWQEPSMYALVGQFHGSYLNCDAGEYNCDNRCCGTASAAPQPFAVSIDTANGTDASPKIQSACAGQDAEWNCEADCTYRSWDLNPWNAGLTENIPINRNAWNDIVIHYKPSLIGEGISQLWVNGVLYKNLQNVTNATNDDFGPYFKFGWYHTSDYTHTVYYDEIRIAENASYADVAPRGSAVSSPVCGNALCESTETCSTCPSDCGVCNVSRNGILFYEDFEDALDTNNWIIRNCAQADNSGSITSSERYAGSNAWHAHVQPYEIEENGATNCSISPRNMREIFSYGDNNYDFGREYWVGYAFKIPETTSFPDSDINPDGGGTEWWLFDQFHGIIEECDSENLNPVGALLPLSVSSPSSVSIFRYGMKADDDECTDKAAIDYSSNKNFSSPLTKGEWHTIVYNFQFNYDSRGFMKIWYDGNLEVDYSGMNCYNQAKGPYQMLGPYGHMHNAIDFFYDEYRIGDETASYQDVAPAGFSAAAPICGNALCESTETCSTCPADCGACPASSQEAPVALWHLDEGSGSTANDASGQNPGTITGPTWTSGISSNALYFDGVDDYVNVGDRQLVTNDLSLSFWFRTEDFSQLNGYAVSKYDITNSAREYAVYFRGIDNYISLLIGNSDGSAFSSVRAQDVASAINAGAWNHLAFTRSGANTAFYLNGVLYPTTDTVTSNDFANTAASLRIGNSADNGRPFQGSLDEVAIYNRVLSSSEVSSLYNSLRPSDTQAPQVGSFSVSPTAISAGTPVTASFAVTDNIALSRAELWRTTELNGQPNSSGWALVSQTSLSGTSRSASLSDTPPAGTFYYGLHVVDAAGNMGTEAVAVRVAVTGEASLGPVTYADSLLGQNCTAGNYSVASRNCSGSDGNAYRTIQAAVDTLAAGDTLVIRGNTGSTYQEYNESVLISRSGTATQKITVMNRQDERVWINGQNPYAPFGAVRLTGNNIVLHSPDGLLRVRTRQDRLQASVSIRVLQFCALISGDYNRISNIDFTDTAFDYVSKYTASDITYMGGVTLGGLYNIIEDSKFSNLSFQVINVEIAARYPTIRRNIISNYIGNAVMTGASNSVLRGMLIENNTISNSYASDGVQFNYSFFCDGLSQSACDLSDRCNWLVDSNACKPDTRLAENADNWGTIIRNNVFTGTFGENIIDLKGTQYIWIDGNIMQGAQGDNDGLLNGGDRSGGMTIMRGSNQPSLNISIRSNIIYDNAGGILLPYSPNSLVGHNTILGNNRDYSGSDNNNEYPIFYGITGYTGPGYRIVNNIIGGNSTADLGMNSGTRMYLNNNFYVNTEQTERLTYSDSYSPVNLAGWKSLISSNSYITGKETDSLAGDPLFLAVDSKPLGSYAAYNWNFQDKSNCAFNITSASPAIDRGAREWPTLITAKSGNIITVREALWFYYDMGNPEVGNVYIYDDDHSRARILSINYATNQITLDNAAEFSVGEGVTWIDYSGTAPDIGALEYGGSAQTFSDTQVPQVSSFSITPTILTAGSPVTANWSVYDNIALQRIELWRTTEINGQPDSNNWVMVRSANLSGTNVSGTTLDIPPAGTFYYGLHVVDAAGNMGTEALPVRVLASGILQSQEGNYFADAVNGNDAWSGLLPAPNAGRTDGPKKTIQSAINSASAGHTVNVLSGTYPEGISIDKPNLTLRVPAGHTASITRRLNSANISIGSNGDGAIIEAIGILNIDDPYEFQTSVDGTYYYGIYGNGADNVVIRGVHIDGPSYEPRTLRIRGYSGYQSVRTRGGGYIFGGIRAGGNNWEVDSAEIFHTTHIGVTFAPAATNGYVHDSYIHDTFYDSVRFAGIAGAQDSYRHKMRVINNVLTNSYISDGVQSNSSALDTVTDFTAAVIRGNIITGHAENAIDFKGGQYTLVEKNLISGIIGNNDGMDDDNPDVAAGNSIWCGSGQRYNNGLHRFNIYIDSQSGPGGPVYYGATYHETSINHARDYRGGNQSTVIGGLNGLFAGRTGSSIKNSISVNAPGGLVRAAAPGTYPGYEIDYNLYFNPDYNSGTARFNRNGTMVDWNTWQSGGYDAHSRVADPRLNLANYLPSEDPAQYDFRPLSDSPAIDSADWLCTVTAKSGNTLALSPYGYRYFYDGFGIPGETPDMIYDDDGFSTRLISIDRSANTITVVDASGIQVGDGLTTVNYAGSAPDIGAREYAGTSQPPADTQAPQVISFSVVPSSLTQGGAVTASYSVSDNTALLRAELWRAVQGTNCTDTNKTGCNWGSAPVAQAGLSGTSRSGTLSDTPPAGTYYYGLHVVDASGNWGAEAAPVRVSVTSAVSSNANVFFYDDCEDAPNLTVDYISGGAPTTFDTNYARSGNGSYKMTVGPGTGIRAELVPKINYPGANNYNLIFEHDYWYGYSFYLPDDWEEPTGYAIPGQWHGTGPICGIDEYDCDGRCCGVGSAPSQPLVFYIDIENGTDESPKMRLQNAGQDDFFNCESDCTFRTWDLNPWGAGAAKDIPINKGSWNDVVVNWKPSISGTGVTKVWVNGVLYFDISGVTNAQNDELGPYFKFGWYHTSTKSHTIYWDEIRIAENASYADVAPRGSAVSSPVCGNGLCESTETCSSCPADCGACPVAGQETPVALWPLNEGSGNIANDSSGQNPGTLVGPVWTTGAQGAGLYFDGNNDYVDIGDKQLATNDISLSFWFKTDDFSLLNAYPVSKYDVANNAREYAVYFRGEGDYISLLAGNSDGSNFTSVVANDISSALNPGAWNHLVFTRSGDSASFYLNGQSYPLSGILGTNNFPDTSARLRLGDRSDGGRPFQGSLDEVAIYNRALTLTEAQNLYNSTRPSDLQAPQVNSFSVSPTSINQGSSITANWSVYDNIALQRIELWRTPELNGQPDSNNWAMVRTATLSGTNVSGTTLDIPPTGTYYYGLHAVDSAGNIGTEAAAVRVVVGASFSFGDPIKWHPGHYMRFLTTHTEANMRTFLANEYTKGISIQLNWQDLEPTKNNYSFNQIDQYLNLVKEYDKYLVVKVMERCFNDCTDAETPSYIRSEPEYSGGVAITYSSDGSVKGSVARVWDPTVVDRLIALYQAIGSRYESDPNFVGVISGAGESALGAGAKISPGYTPTNYETQMKRQASAIASAMPTSLGLMGLNHFADGAGGEVETFNRLAGHLSSVGQGAIIHPDTMPNLPDGNLYQVENANSNFIAICPEFNTYNILEGISEEDIYLFARDQLGAHIVFWNQHFTSKTGESRPNYIIDYVFPVINKYQGQINTACPTSYQSCQSD